MTKKTKAKKTAKPKTKKKAKRATPDQWIETVCDIAEQIGTSTKILGRGMAPESINLIEAMRVIAEAAQPITGRGVGYKLFVQKLIPSMERSDMRRVYRLLLKAREEGIIPWEWIVDETRGIERVATWSNIEAYVRATMRDYRRDFWQQQPHRVQVWSEKGTVRGLLAPVLDEYAVGFNPVHGFNSGTNTHETAEDDDGRPLIILYVGDFDPSGMFMSEVDLPKRFDRYEGYHITLQRIALTPAHTPGLPSFPAADKIKDPRYKWFVANHGRQCWELDAMDPNDLRDCVEEEITKLIEPDAWARCEVVNRAEQESIREVLSKFPRS
jgi:hypothetical protein